MEDKIKNYVRGIIFKLIPLEKREEVTGQIYEQTKDLKSIYQIEYVIKGILLKCQKHKEQEGAISKVSKEISEFIISQNRRQ